ARRARCGSRRAPAPGAAPGPRPPRPPRRPGTARRHCRARGRARAPAARRSWSPAWHVGLNRLLQGQRGPPGEEVAADDAVLEIAHPAVDAMAGIRVERHLALRAQLL